MLEVFCLSFPGNVFFLWQKDGSRDGWTVSEKKDVLIDRTGKSPSEGDPCSRWRSRHVDLEPTSVQPVCVVELANLKWPSA